MSNDSNFKNCNDKNSNLKNIFPLPEHFENIFPENEIQYELVEKVVKQFTINKKRNIVVINGISGIGKSWLAYQYAQNNKNLFNAGILWFNINNYSNLELIFNKLTKLLNIGDIAKKSNKNYIYETLSEQGKFLLIFDNIPAFLSEKNIKDFLPTNSCRNNICNIIITTR